jgi:hypothetical protein
VSVVTHELLVNLVNKENLRLAVPMLTTEECSTPLAHELCRLAERRTNDSQFHFLRGPWKVASYGWTR